MSKSSTPNSVVLSRRDALKLSAGAGIAAAIPTSAHASDSIKTGVHQQEPGFCSTPPSAVAQPNTAKSAATSMAMSSPSKASPTARTPEGNRWLPPSPPVPWQGEYPALIYGANCPQRLHIGIVRAGLSSRTGTTAGKVKTCSSSTSGRPRLSGSRPVMFYMHGGGFSFGSSYELPSHEGAQMARHHDVVQVSVNHRLNALGFLDVSEVGGPAYADSANVGMTDLVAALQWVRDNIANFGGDPGQRHDLRPVRRRRKVAALMGMPSAKGLFHCAAIQSGGGFASPQPTKTRQLTHQMMKDLGLAPNDIGALRKMDWKDLWRPPMRPKPSSRPIPTCPSACTARRAASGCPSSMAASST